MTGCGGGQHNAGVRQRGEGVRERGGEGVRERGEGGCDSGAVQRGDWSRPRLGEPLEAGRSTAAAPEADVSDRPGRPEAPPRSIAGRPALTGARRPAR